MLKLNFKKTIGWSGFLLATSWSTAPASTEGFGSNAAGALLIHAYQVRHHAYHLLWSDHRGEKITKAVLYATLFVGGVCGVCAKWLWLPQIKKTYLKEMKLENDQLKLVTEEEKKLKETVNRLTEEKENLNQSLLQSQQALQTQRDLNTQQEQVYSKMLTEKLKGQKQIFETQTKNLQEAYETKINKLQETHRTQLEAGQKELNEQKKQRELLAQQNKQLKAQKTASTTYMGALLALYLADSQPSLFSSDNFEENGGSFFGSKKKKLKRDKNLMDQFDLKRAAHALLKWFGFDGKNKSLDIKKVEKTYTNYQKTIKNQSPSNDLDLLKAVKR